MIIDRRRTLDQFIRDVQIQFQELFWKDVPRQASANDFEFWKSQTRQAAAALARQRVNLENLCKRMTEMEKKASALAFRVQMYHRVSDHENAWQHALELERLRNIINRERKELKQAHKNYRLQCAHLDHLKRRLAEIKEEAYSPW